MRIAIAGAGNVGRSIARELMGNGHEVLLIDKDAAVLRSLNLEGAQMFVADACEISALQDADLAHCQVVVAATGDDNAFAGRAGQSGGCALRPTSCERGGGRATAHWRSL